MTQREEVWLKAWCAVANAWNCQDTKAADTWADKCLKSFEERFVCSIVGIKEPFGDLGDIDLPVTSCCNVGPITSENYCPKCGKRIRSVEEHKSVESVR